VPLRSATFGFDLARDTYDRAERGAADDQRDQERSVEVENPFEGGAAQPRSDECAEQTGADSASCHTPTIDHADRRDEPPSVYLASDFGRFRLATADVHLTGRCFPLMLH
jgi:hypothetical protein